MIDATRRPGDKLFNVTKRVVELVWAATPEEADDLMAAHLDGLGLEVLPDPSTAFVSEPVEIYGWEG